MSLSFNNRLTQLLNIKTPIICPPMAFVDGGLLAAKVTQAGAFGFLCTRHRSSEKFREELAIARSALNSHPSQPATLPIGIGFICWLLEANDSQELASLEFALENRPKAIWLAFGTDIGRWVRYIREFDQNRGDGHKTLIFVEVNSVSEALTAVNDWQVDVLVAQGHEAGGHGHTSAPPLHILVTAVLSALGDKCPPLVAAGGLAVGRQIASVLTLGASGAVLGTRFALSEECLYPEALKKALLDAGISSTVRTKAFDYARRTTGWPEGIDGRGIRNDLVNTYDRGDSIEVLNKKLEDGIKAQDPDRSVVWAGIGIGLMNEIKRAEDIVKELHQGTLEALIAAHNIVRS